MSKLRLINCKYPWLKIVIFLVIFFSSLSISVGFLIGERDTSLVSAQANGGALGGYTDVAPVLIEGEVKEVQGVDEAAEETKEEVQEPEQDRAAELEGKMLIALTFDDGPLPEVTERILDILKEKNVKATFFMVGMQVDKYPETAKKVKEAGHQIGNHSMRHRNLTELGQDELLEDIATSKAAIKKATGVEAGMLRPPYGYFDEDMASWLNELIVTWNVDSLDWRDMNAEAAYGNVMSAVTDGSVILMHDLYQSTAEALPGIIDELKAAGYEFVTVDEMLKYRDWVPGEL